VVAATAAATTAAADSALRPNVLLIISDDQGWTDFGFMAMTWSRRQASTGCLTGVVFPTPT